MTYKKVSLKHAEVEFKQNVFLKFPPETAHLVYFDYFLEVVMFLNKKNCLKNYFERREILIERVDPDFTLMVITRTRTHTHTTHTPTHTPMQRLIHTHALYQLARARVQFMFLA